MTKVSAADAAGSVDQAPLAKRQAPLVYPYEQLIKGESGIGEVSFVVDMTGRVMFTSSISGGERAYAQAAIAMVEASEFSPARKGKKTVFSTMTETVRFSIEDSLDEEGRRVLAELRKPAPAIKSVADLDDRPRVIAQNAPVYPRAMKSDALTGSAEIEFVIDKNGVVRFPRIVSATHPDFGWAAATAVAQWRYEKPVSNGENVDVRVVVPIVFDEQKLASTD